jgi:hypothetical protein
MLSWSNKMLSAFISSNHSISQSGSSKKAEAAALNVTGIKGGSEKRKKDKTSGLKCQRSCLAKKKEQRLNGEQPSG